MFFLIPLAAFLGLLGGFCLHKFIPEEEEQIKPYLFYAEKIILALLIVVIFYESFIFSLPVILFLLGGIVAGFLFSETYMYFGFALLSLTFLPAVLVFLYGLTQYKNLFFKGIFFLPFLFLILSIETGFFQMFAAGALGVLLFRSK